MCCTVPTMEDHATTSPEPEHDALSADPEVGPLVRLAALAHTLDAPGAPTPSHAALRDGLAALGAAEAALERAALVVTAHARAAGLTWTEIAAAQGGRADALAKRHTRRRERFPDYTPPPPPTLEAHTARAADLLAPVLAERPLSPFLARLAAERLGAVLLAAHWEGVDDVAVASWLHDDALSEPQQRLHHHYDDQAVAARGVLNAHALDPAPVQSALVQLMRAAVGAEDLVRHLHPVHPGPRPAWAVPAADREDGTAAADRPHVTPRWGSVQECAQALTRAGLDPTAAAALAGPLSEFVTTAERVKHQQRDGEVRNVLHALAPVLFDGDPTRLRLLLGALPRLDLAGLEEWAHLYLALAEHAPHLEQCADTATLVAEAGLPGQLARPLTELVDAARLPVLASYAPAAPASAVADLLAAVIVAVDTARAADLPALLDRLVQAQRPDLAADRPHRLTEPWEELMHHHVPGRR